jgi:TP901 family phage tail tape measure protein
MATEKFNLSIILSFVNKAAPEMRKFSKQLKTVGNQMKGIGQTASLALTAPIVALGGFALKSAIDMESAFTGVQKTVNGTAHELGVLKEELKGLSLNIPLSAVELFNVAEAAGQLGIKTKNIASFTKVMADLGATTNITAQDAAISLAQFANITGMAATDFDRLGSVIAGLGNETETSEAKIVAMSLRLAAAGTLVGLSEAKIVALAASLSSVGIEAEAGGSAFSQVLRRIDKEIGTGSEKMDNFAKVAGKSTKEFEKAWKEDAASAVLDFVAGLDEAKELGVNVNQILDKLGFQGIRISDSLLRAAGANEKFNKNMVNGSKFWKENIALTKEAALRYGTTASKLVVFKNNVKLAANEFGKSMIPSLNKALVELKPFVDTLKNLGPETKETILRIAGLLAVGGPLLFAVGVASTAIAAAFSPIGLAVISLTALGVAIIAIRSKLRAAGLLEDKEKNLRVTQGRDPRFGGSGSFPLSPQKITSRIRSTQAPGVIPGHETFKRSVPSEVIIKVQSEKGTSATIEKVQNDDPGVGLTVNNIAVVGL